LTPPHPQLKGAWYPGGFNPCTHQVKPRFRQSLLSNASCAVPLPDGRAHLLKPTGELLGRIPGADDADAAPSAAPAVHALAFSKGSRYLATVGLCTLNQVDP
jgi:hypothetical protein